MKSQEQVSQSSLDESKTFKIHINNLAHKISRQSGLLYQIKDIMPPQTTQTQILKLDYTSLFAIDLIMYLNKPT